jgi:hypothetical protein
MEYKIVHTTQGISIFEKEVNEAIRAGWQPLGGPFEETNYGPHQLCQAMIHPNKHERQWTEGGYIAR